jgi:hypothetical protein
MVTIFIVVSPSGKVGYIGENEYMARSYRQTDYSFQQGYECHTVEAGTPWRAVPIEEVEVPELGEA